MGGGNNDDALALLATAAAKGDWVCLKNLHLVTPAPATQYSRTQ